MTRPGEVVPDRRELLAHDIRSAMSDVIGGIRLVDRERLPDAALEQIDRAQAAAELLARLVEELLADAPREPAGAVGNLNLARFLDDELRRWHGVARASGGRVTLDRAADVPQIVRLDLLHLRRVVANLMGNAVRHAPGTHVTLAAALTPAGALEIAVRDDGPGFPEAILPDLFKPSVRAAGGAPGTGMGLHIADFHASEIGGTLVARNRPEGGAEVALALPPSVWQRESEPAGGLPDLSGARILVADDSAVNRTLVEGMLNRLGAVCETAADGIEALNWLARERFDLALVDIEMPVLGGLDVLRAERLRQARGIAPPTAMVAMTAYAQGDNRDAIADAGADGVIAKPLTGIGPFGRAVAGYLSQAPDRAAWRPDAAPALSGVMLTELLAAAGPHYEAQLLDRLRADLAAAETGLAAAAEAADRSAMAAQTHVLLSLAGAVGALPTQEAARHLDRLLREGGPAEAIIPAARLALTRLAALRRDLEEADGLRSAPV